MSYGWENHEPAPMEHFHHLLLEYFHEYRRATVGQEKLSVEMSGTEFNNIVAKAKTETYKKYEKLDLRKTILKTDLL